MSWQHQKAIAFRRVGRGKVRSYDLGDALHLAVIAELAAVGVGITGKGAMLSEALTGYAEHHLRRHGSADDLGALALIPDGDDWRMDHQIHRAGRRGSFVVVALDEVAAGVIGRAG